MRKSSVKVCPTFLNIKKINTILVVVFLSVCFRLLTYSAYFLFTSSFWCIETEVITTKPLNISKQLTEDFSGWLQTVVWGGGQHSTPLMYRKGNP